MSAIAETPSVSSAAADLAARVAELPNWSHRIELPGGIVTPGWSPISAISYGIPVDLTGMRVLDAGARDGYWTFEALKRGAREVVALNDFTAARAGGDHSDWSRFELCREALGYSATSCRRVESAEYDISRDELGGFDVVFHFGRLHHLRHPLLAIDKLAAVCDGDMYIETAILDDFSPFQGGLGKGYPGGQMVAEFYPENQYGNDDTNWWVPTLKCLCYWVQSAGFVEAKGWKLTVQPPSMLSHCRGFAKAVRKAA